MSYRFRYTFILCLVGLATALAALGGWRYARASSPVSGPIVLISVDTLRADHLPAYGYRGVQTPAFDTLVADGVVFERAYSHSPQTLPAHASLLSGRLPFETGVRDNAGFAVKDEERLVAEILADRGYATGGVVSSFVLRRDTGIAQGFSFFDAEWPAASPASGERVTRDGLESERIAERWLASNRNERAFLFLHLYEPHAPYEPPSRYERYPSYDGEIAYVDEIVGRLVKYLKAHQLYDQSTIILLADHGEGLGDHGETGHGLLVYEEALHVPLIVKPAAGQGAGRRVKDLVQLVDVVPTILDLAKAPIPDHLPGLSLKPLIDGGGRFPKRIVYSESLMGTYRFGWAPLLSVTDGQYRLIQGPREELEAFGPNPVERNNVVGGRGTEYTALKAALARISAAAIPKPPPQLPQEDRAKLASLGYPSFTAIGNRHADTPLEDDIALLETYRTAMENAVNRQWPQAIELVQNILHDRPESADLWIQLAEFSERAGRFDKALDAYAHASALRPEDPAPHLGAAMALFRLRKLDEARRHAARGAELARDGGSRTRAAITSSFIEAKQSYDRGRFDEALALFEGALADLKKGQAAPVPDLHFYTADTLTRLERLPEAEYHLLEELKSFPQNARARGALAVIYHETGRSDEAAEALTDLVRVVPTPEAYDLAARLWSSFGNPQQAAAARADRARLPAQARR